MKLQTKASAVTTAGLLISLGIIYGDIGTSPLYVMKAIIGDAPISQALVYGGISCVFWTLTLQTTVKYVLLTLQADNNGEGGVFSLYTLIRRKAPWLIVPAMLGGAALLADGIITPPISVSSAIEGLRILYPDIPTVPIVLAILTALFLMQSFGTEIVGKAFGPIMLLWFVMLGSLGAVSVAHHPEILKALSPYYAYNLLAHYPRGFWLLGAVFLCTTGAEALYSDLGHCGRPNIRLSWLFVKTCLLLNYLGQGAWLMTKEGSLLQENPFYGIMPAWFVLPGIAIATVAAIIASQALISGSFTLISEAIRLNLWPRVRLVYPSNQKGQLYVPSINWLLWVGCVGVVLYFRESEHMEAAYGLAITMAMLSTTILMSYYLYTKCRSMTLVSLFLTIYISIEGAFLVANLSKFPHGGWVSLLIAGALLAIMYIWLNAFHIKRRLTEYVRLKDYLPALKELSADETIPKYATHLVFMTSASSTKEIESKVIYSIFQKRPKRTDIYWFVHVDISDEPYTTEYKVCKIAEGDVIRIDFTLGFRVEQRINLFFRKVVEELVANGEVDITSRYPSLNRQHLIGDFRFVVLEKFLSFENDLPFRERLIMEWYFNIKRYASSESKWFGLDSSSVKIEKVPLIILPAALPQLKRVPA
ncbi:KUP system potassium uptake protein [Pontibacter ummariensis]|uniref:Probable potassium transport system protein Kup n=1 Tax=Pontibacter ummariensis TaxID=1610492 RepID=A0A239C2B9_9BACT|nr:KUP/HAK/KT family potassium transporter [Pontibacter ummariensis]PRY15482.1 KUP system potassium uptake protein [Pontibacter ummariensis]SNS14445.1 KUP system potassium uptake protein [Pontibacter ummariensis]